MYKGTLVHLVLFSNCRLYACKLLYLRVLIYFNYVLNKCKILIDHSSVHV